MKQVVQRPRVAVIGTGYLGATHAAGMAEVGFDVIGLDIDESKVAALNLGRVPFYEPELPELLQKHLDSGRLRFTTSYDEVAEFADVHFICVGTPQQSGSYAADMTYVESAVKELAMRLHRPALIVGKSTVPAGTAARLDTLIHSLSPCPDVELAWNPEFLREGLAVQDTLRPDRLVFGVHSQWAEDQLRAVYAPVIAAGTPVVTMDYATAELVKVAANSFLATKISFINAMAEVCEVVGADVTKLADAIGRDDRIGRRFLSAGLGFGGGCLPKDIRGFIHRADELKVDQAVSFLRQIDEINMRRRKRTLELGAELIGGHYRGKRVAVLGAAFKPDSDDIRDSPALDVAATAHERGADVVLYDPQAMGPAKQKRPELTYAVSLDHALEGAELVMLLTEWREFREMDPVAVAPLVRNTRILDGRNVLDPTQWRQAGWEYRALGRP